MREKIKISIVILGILLSNISLCHEVSAANCPDLRVVFARGSGGKYNEDPNYLEYKSSIESKLKNTSLKYEFIDLDYPAVGVGIDNLDTTIGAYVGAGNTYEFGESVNTGVKNLIRMINDARCPNTKYVIGGYSQGAMVISKALSSLKSDRVIYAATFGDPKLYLPEGKGLLPKACRGVELSNYRTYVPDCRAFKGLLGAYIPYQPSGFKDKLGSWCNKRDIFCSSYSNVSHHLRYIDDHLYEDASRIIYDKITKHFRIKNTVTSPHDTAFLIDTTGSMENMIEKYKAEALRLAKETLDSGGRVALFDYRDLDDPYAPVEYCNFENCTYEKFQQAIEKIQTDNGGDSLESLLSASFHVMKTLKWKFGATKSLVVLTDDGFLSPDRDGVTMKDVVNLSKNIDPVNFYIITDEDSVSQYTELATLTDGKAVVLDDEISLLTNHIMERYDSLPRTEEDDRALNLPSIKLLSKYFDNDMARLSFETTAEKVLVILNDQIIGTTNENEINISGLKRGVKNIISLVPIDGDYRGEGVLIEVETLTTNISLPKAPNTGRR